MKALIGYTGFVGGNLRRQSSFDELFNSKNIHDIAGKSYDLIVSAGQGAEKWKINQAPAADAASLEMLTDALDQTEAQLFVLISTIDVYPHPVEVNEDNAPDRHGLGPYGEHRLKLEQYVASHFENHLIVRLPALFGPGLKKNVIYDFLTDNRDYFPRIHADSTFQFYNLTRLWSDLSDMTEAGISLVNLATEPMSVAEIAIDCFGSEFDNRPSGMTPARYDFRSIHAERLGGRDDYLYSKSRVKRDLAKFVRNWKESN
jgi:dTDP-4-dehydrorhamnose reductase